MTPHGQRRTWSTAAALAGCAFALTACNGPQSSGTTDSPSATAPTASSSAAGKKLGCAVPTFTHPFFIAMKKGLEEEAKAEGAEINVVDAQDSPDKQLAAIDNFLVTKVDAIILCPTESGAMKNGVEKANSAKIPVITVNRTVDAPVVTYVGADDTEGGRLQGQAVLEALPQGGKIALMQGVIGSSPQRDREAGLEEALKGHANCQIVQKSPYEFQRVKGVSVVDTILLKFPKGKLDVIVAQSDDGALAAADECAKQGRTEIKIIGFNGESDAFEQVKSGAIYATVLQDAATQGREAVKATLKYLKGEKVPEKQITPLVLITKKNIGKYQPAWESSKI